MQPCQALHESPITSGNYCTLTLGLADSTHPPLSDSVDLDQTVRSVQSDLRSTLSDKKIFFPQSNFEIAIIGLTRSTGKFSFHLFKRLRI